MTARNDFDGSMATFITTTGTIADGVFSVAGTNATLTEFDNTASSDKWTSCMLVLSATYSVDPGTDKTIDIYMFETDIDGTSGHDEVAPATDEANGAKYVGSFKVVDGTSLFYSRTDISLVGKKKFKLAIINNAGQTLSSGATVKMEAFGFNDS